MLTNQHEGKHMKTTMKWTVAAVLCFAALSAQAETYTWNKTGWTSGGYSWDAAANWTSPGDYPNAVGDIADFRIALVWGAGCPVKLNRTITVGTLYIGGTGSNSGHEVNITAGTAGSLIMDATGTASATITKTITTNTANDDILANVALNDNLIVNNAATAASAGITISGIISNYDTTARSLTKDGVGLLTLSGANAFTGGTTLNLGTLTIGTGGTLGAATGTLSVNNTNTAAGKNVILNLNTAADTTVGSLSGTIATPSSGANTATINTQVGRTFTINQTADATYAGVIAGAGNVTLGSSSTHTLTLSGVNTYTGETKVAAGTLALTGSGSIANSTTITVDAGATLDVSGTTSGLLTLGSGQTLAGAGTIAGDLAFGSGAKFLFSATDTLIYTGTSNIGFTGFSLSSLVGLDGTAAINTYTLISGNTDFFTSDISNVGYENRGSIGGGKEAYFEEGSLKLVVIPEPATFGIVLSALAAAIIRRKRFG
jgi:fibronectin-binding autotransporter adhesin